MILSLNNAPALQRAGFGIAQFLHLIRRLVNLVSFVLSRCMRYNALRLSLNNIVYR